MSELLQRFKVPLGSLVVDVGLVIYVTFTAGQIVERLESMNGRLHKLEEVQITPQADRRLAAVEVEVGVLKGDNAEIRQDVVKRLERIEDKIDDHIAHEGGRR